MCSYKNTDNEEVKRAMGVNIIVVKKDINHEYYIIKRFYFNTNK